MKESDVIRRAVGALGACLQDVPFVDPKRWDEPVAEVAGVDLLIDLPLRTGRAARLLVEARRSGEPRQAREAALVLLRATRQVPGAVPVFVAPYVAPPAASILREEGVGYADLAGNCRLVLDGVYVERSGRPNPLAEKRPLLSIYHAKGERVLRVLLSHPGRVWTLQALAAAAEVSLGHVHKVKEALRDIEWVDQSRDGLRVTQPLQALREWARNADWRRNSATGYYSMDRPAAEQGISAVCDALGIRCALTQFAGAERLAPYTRYLRASAYVESREDEVAEAFGLRRAESGANLLLLRPYDEGVFYDRRRIEGAWVASPVQLYVDLIASHARGEEAAEHLLENEIAPLWAT